MAITKDNLVTAVRNLIDDPIAAFWTAANLTVLISTTYDEMWGDILDFAPYYKSTIETVTTTPKLTANGTIDIPSLASRFYRLQSIVRYGKVLDPANPRDVMIQANEAIVGPDGHYAHIGDQIYMFPISATESLEIRYAPLPADFVALGGSSPITWPDGFESALIFESAARAMLKGEREENARLARLAEKSWNSLLSAVKRRRFALTPYDLRSPLEYGST